MNLIKDKRLKRNLTQEEMAKMLSISRSSYTAYEIGLRKPSIEMAYKIANILKIPKAKMLEEFGKEE